MLVFDIWCNRMELCCFFLLLLLLLTTYTNFICIICWVRICSYYFFNNFINFCWILLLKNWNKILIQITFRTSLHSTKGKWEEKRKNNLSALFNQENITIEGMNVQSKDSNRRCKHYRKQCFYEKCRKVNIYCKQISLISITFTPPDWALTMLREKSNFISANIYR